MSSAQLHRVLRAVVVVQDDARREALAGMLSELGHTVVAAAATVKDLAKAQLGAAKPEVVLSNLASVTTLAELERILDADDLHLPVVLVNSDLQKVAEVANLESVVAGYLYPERSEELGPMLIIAWRQYEKHQADRDWNRAIRILMDRHRLESLEEGEKFLITIIKSHQDTVPDRIRKIIEADQVMRPRRSRGKAGEKPRRKR